MSPELVTALRARKAQRYNIDLAIQAIERLDTAASDEPLVGAAAVPVVVMDVEDEARRRPSVSRRKVATASPSVAARTVTPGDLHARILEVLDAGPMATMAVAKRLGLSRRPGRGRAQHPRSQAPRALHRRDAVLTVGKEREQARVTRIPSPWERPRENFTASMEERVPEMRLTKENRLVKGTSREA